MPINENVVTFILPGSTTAWSKIDDSKDNEKNGRILNEQLLTAMQMENIVVLAGSGASLSEGGGPSMYDLWNDCTKSSEKKYLQESTEIFNLVGYDVSDENKVNIEELLSMCEAFLGINSEYAILNKEKINTFVHRCKKIILDKCRFEKSDEFLNGHKRFIHRLSRRRVKDSRLNIFTTNYDTAFEEAASKLGIVVIDGFSFTKPRQYDARFFDYDIVKRGIGNSSNPSYLEGVFKLFKLHGSVNWQKDSLDRIQENDAVNAENSCMIFPAKGKYQQSYIQPHLELMARYLSALREPNTCLLIVGFGFNDNHLSEPILSAIKSNPHLKVIIVNPSIVANISNNNCNPYWKKLDDCRKNGEDICFIESTFSKLSTLIPDLKALTPSEKLAQTIKQISGET